MRLFIPMLLCGALAACGGEAGHEGHDHAGETAEEHAAHAAHEEHAAAHGGTLVELTGHAGHVEALHDAQAGTLTVWITDAEMAPMTPDQAPVMNFVADGKPVQLTGEESDGAWAFAHDGLKGEPEGARLRIKVGGKTYTPELAHEHE